MSHGFDLGRFTDAQGAVYDTALAELRAGHKRSHWMWFVFPQLRGLGQSAMAHKYGIASVAEAGAYLAHPVLGARLVACTEAVLACGGSSLRGIFGTPDDLKFASSMTLFEAAGGGQLFGAAIERWCGGRRDAATLQLLGG